MAFNPTKPVDARMLEGGELDPLFANTQGHILEKHRRDCMWNLLLRFEGVEAASVLASLAEHGAIASVAQLRREGAEIREALAKGEQPSPLEPTCFLGISSSGVKKLNINARLFDPSYRQGLHRRLGPDMRLDDAKWNSEWKQTPSDDPDDKVLRFHAVLLCAGNDDAELDSFTSALTTSLGGAVQVARIEKCRVKRVDGDGVSRGDSIEHFGFKDGLSQPVFYPSGSGAAQTWTSGFNPNFALSQVVITDPLSADHYGSMMAYLRIEQHLDEFSKVVDALASQVHPPAGKDAKEHAAALIIGRYRNGDPLFTLAADADSNDFARTGDTKGSIWPFASHICKMNSREGEPVFRRPIVRRGMTYQEDSGERGLIFQSFQASLSDQFEQQFVTWASSVHFPRPNTGRDPILTSGSDKQCYPTDGGFQLCASGLTTVRGGEYFYFPSIPGIASLGSR